MNFKIKDYNKYNNCKELIYENLYDAPFSKIIAKKIPPYYVYNSFKRSYRRETNTSFDISTVIGTDHPNYNNKSWAEIVKSLRRQNRFDINCKKGSIRPSIDYYINEEYRNNSVHDPWSIVVINNEAYVTQGHHRTTISKYLNYFGIIPAIQFGLDFVEYYEVDFYEYRRFKKIKKYFSQKYPIIGDLDIKIKSKQSKTDELIFYPVYEIHIGPYYDIEQKESYVEVLVANSLKDLKKLIYKHFIHDNLVWKLNNQILLITKYLKKYIKNRKVNY
jgi:hypothetical protein